MKKWIIGIVVAAGSGIWVYFAMRQTYGPYGVVRRTQCLNNLKSMGRASLLYSEAHDGRLMLSSRWMDLLSNPSKGGSRYLQNEELLRCPCIPHPDAASRFGYAFNSELSGARVSSFELPEHMPLIYESKDWRRNVADPLKSFSGPLDPNVSDSERAYVVYLSGHVKRSIRGEN